MNNHYHGQKKPLIIIASVASILSFIPLKSFFKKLSIFDPIFLKFALIKSVILFFQAENSCRVIERHGHRLLTSLVGDSLLEPFWPTGTGCARGFFGGLDACWLMRTMALGNFMADSCVVTLQLQSEQKVFCARLTPAAM